MRRVVWCRNGGERGRGALDGDSALGLKLQVESLGPNKASSCPGVNNLIQQSWRQIESKQAGLGLGLSIDPP